MTERDLDFILVTFFYTSSLSFVRFYPQQSSKSGITRLLSEVLALCDP